MRAEFRSDFTTPTGEVAREGAHVTMLESILKWEVTPSGSNDTFSIPREDLRIACEVHGCTEEAEYDAPGHWCSTHWNEWWYEGSEEGGPEWMQNYSEEQALCITLKQGLAHKGTELFPEGTVVFPKGKYLAVRVAFNNCEFEVDRSFLSIQCEVDGCTEEAAIWHPCYCCRSHYMAWADGKILLPNAAE